MSVLQVVLLLDLDSITHDISGKTTQIQILRRAILKLLTFFATHQCASDSNASLNLKWGCKYYYSLEKKTIRQRCTFNDFTLDTFEKFENELEDKLQKRRLDLGACQEQQGKSQQNQSARITRNSVFANLDVNKSSVSATTLALSNSEGNVLSYKTRVCNLEQALKELACDYAWDQPYLCSPVRTTRRHSQQNGETRRNSNNTAGSVQNFVIIITGVPKCYKELEGIVEGKQKVSQNVLLNKILPSSLRQQLCQVSKIRLFWLDTSEIVANKTKGEFSSENRKVAELFHQVLRKVGGGLIPYNVFLPTPYEDESKSSKDASLPRFNKHVPKTLTFLLPFTPFMSGLLLEEESDQHTHHQIYPQLHLGNGQGKHTICQLELLPLFRLNFSNSESGDSPCKHCGNLRIACTNKSVDKKSGLDKSNLNSTKNFTMTCISSIEKSNNSPCYFPQDIRPIGTILLNEIHSQLIAKPLVYLCCSKDPTPLGNQTKVDTLNQLLLELATNQMAMLVSCDDLCQGILFPANDRCRIALLYILTSEGESTLFAKTIGPVSVPKDINKFVQESLKGRVIPRRSPQNQPSGLINEQVNIFKNLKKAYIKSHLIQTETCKNGQLRRSPRLKKVPESSASPKVSKLVSRNLLTQKDSESKDQTKIRLNHKTTVLINEACASSDIQGQVSETEMLQNLKRSYEDALLSDMSVFSVVQRILGLCLSFYKSQDAKKAELCTRDVICNHFLMKPGDVTERHSDMIQTMKKQMIREHCFQSIVRLELLMLSLNDSESYVDEITSHLRKLSFLAGPSVLSQFLQETLVENYYKHLKDVISEICEELNQPLSCDDAASSPGSADDRLFSPDKPNSPPTSVRSQMSALSSVSSSSNHSRSFRCKRSEAVIRHPSFGNIVHKRRIAISHLHSKQQLKLPKHSGPLTRSAQKMLKDKLRATNEVKTRSSGARRSLFDTSKAATVAPTQRKPTTPNGCHVLKTKTVADTPIHKQVAKPLLRRQSMKRKYTSENESLEEEFVEESPDKQPGPSFGLRRSPKRHASTLQRESSFYSVFPDTKTLENPISETPNSLRRSQRTVAQQDCPTVTPESRSRVKRVLILGDTPKRERTTPLKENKGKFNLFSTRHSPRLSTTVTSQNDGQGPNETPNSLRRSTRSRSFEVPEKCEPVEKLMGSARKSPRLNKSLPDFKPSEIGPSKKSPAAKNKTPRKSVSRKLLQTPAKIKDTPIEDSSLPPKPRRCDEEWVPSTPIKNGLESPEASPNHVFLYGPLAAKLDDYLSRSSSPIIPLLGDKVADYYEDQNQFKGLDLTDALKCDDFDDCPYGEMDFNELFSDLRSDNGSPVSDAIVPDEQHLPENIDFAFTPSKNSLLEITSPECALPPWETQNGFDHAFGRLAKRKLSLEDPEPRKCASLESIQFSSMDTRDTFEETSCSSAFNDNSCNGARPREVKLRKKSVSGSSDGLLLQRFTRQASKEIGISLNEFKKIAVEVIAPKKQSFSEFRSTDMEAKKNRKTISTNNKLQDEHSPSPTKLNITKSKFASPSVNSLFHLTNSPILSSVSSRLTRNNRARQLKNEGSIQR